MPPSVEGRRPAPPPVDPAPAVATPSPVAHDSPNPTDPMEVWKRICERAGGGPGTASLMGAMRLDRFEGDTAVVVISDPSKAGRARIKQEWLRDLLREALPGRAVRVVFSVAGEASNNDPETDSGASSHHEAMRHPLVRRAMELFDARLIEVKRESQGHTPGAD